MITINLLPQTHRSPKAGSIQQFHRSPLALMLLGGLVGLAGLLAAWRGITQVRLARARERLQALAPKRSAVDHLKASIALLQHQTRALEEADRQRSAWATRLNAISDLMPPGVWFTDLTLDPQKLVLHGAAARQQGEEMTVLNRLARDLKQDARLATVMSEIQLGELRNIQDGEIELMEFTMTCRLLSGSEPPAGKSAGRSK